MTETIDKIEKEMDYMELNNQSFQMGLINIGPYMELMNHHINKIRKLLNEKPKEPEAPKECTIRTCKHSYIY